MKIYLHRQFKREVKTLIKKYPSLKTDIAELISELQINPTLGESLGKNRYKIRLKITSKHFLSSSMMNFGYSVYTTNRTFRA
jgi:mRNA-degrading endonuclease YafQ of YafQ-DinJ toxin-antitoxin module